MKNFFCRCMKLEGCKVGRLKFCKVGTDYRQNYTKIRTKKASNLVIRLKAFAVMVQLVQVAEAVKPSVVHNLCIMRQTKLQAIPCSLFSFS
jgi:hypothetical protein